MPVGLDLVDKIADYWARELVEPFDRALSELYVHGTTRIKTTTRWQDITVTEANYHLFAIELSLDDYALYRIKRDHGIRNPPPWLISAYTGKAYELDACRP